MVRPIYVVLVIKTTRHQGKQLFYCIMISSLQVLLVFIFLLSFMFNVKLSDNFCEILDNSQLIPGIAKFFARGFSAVGRLGDKNPLATKLPKIYAYF